MVGLPGREGVAESSERSESEEEEEGTELNGELEPSMERGQSMVNERGRRRCDRGRYNNNSDGRGFGV